ncbi:MAG: helix-turn-helix transcriptional regulator [Solirubrobacteraceae bacterium]|jgi:ribosome-binding protein aMBF1 (putative translation factor)
MPPGETDYCERRRKTWLNDPETRGHYERERREIEQVDAVIRSLDQLRVDAGVSKAELARRIGRNPSSIRRLFTARGARPELPLIVSIADELGARVEITTREPHGRGVRQRESRQARFQ